MQYPPTPNSGYGSSPADPRACSPSLLNAPRMRTLDLPPSPQNNAPPLPGHRHPNGAPFFSGLPTPPDSPEKRGMPAVMLHPSLDARARPLRFNLAGHGAALDPAALSVPAFSCAVRQLTISVYGIFPVTVVAPNGAPTVLQIVQQLCAALAQPPSQNEFQRCHQTIQASAFAQAKMQGRQYVVRGDMLGANVWFAGLQLTSADPRSGIVTCELTPRAQ